MTSPYDKPPAAGPFEWLLTSLDEWSRLLLVAQELREVDRECMETMLEARASGPDPLSPEETVKVRSLVQMLRSLDLDPEAIRLKHPEVMQKLEIVVTAAAPNAAAVT